VINAAARLVFPSSKCDHITPHHERQLDLHCLKVPWRIDYKLAVLVYKCLHGLAPSYLADELYHPALQQTEQSPGADPGIRVRGASPSLSPSSLYFPFPPSLPPPLLSCPLPSRPLPSRTIPYPSLPSPLLKSRPPVLRLWGLRERLSLGFYRLLLRQSWDMGF